MIDPPFPDIQATASYQDQDRRIVEYMRSATASADTPLRILEAGCGNRWPLDLQGIAYRLTGVDLDAAALDIRLRVEKDLDGAIHGDLSTVVLPNESFDVVYCAYVLEHIRNADTALDNLIGSLRVGGLLIIRIPDPDTARGLVTRLSPFWFHVMFHRWVMRRPHAGKPGYAPYPTYYHPVISRTGIRTFAQHRHLVCKSILADTFVRDGKGVAGFVFRMGARLVGLLSAGRFTSRYQDLVYVFEKTVASANASVRLPD